MAKIISASIDLAKIDKTKIVSTDKNGQPFQNGAKYLNLQITLNDEADQYGNTVSIKINQTKQERDAQVKPVYLGNGKVVWEGEPHPPAQQSQTAPVMNNTDMSDLPF